MKRCLEIDAEIYVCLPLRNSQSERDKRGDIKQDNPDFITNHARIMKCIEGFRREVEASIVEAIQPVMGKTKYAKPYHG